MPMPVLVDRAFRYAAEASSGRKSMEIHHALAYQETTEIPKPLSAASADKTDNGDRPSTPAPDMRVYKNRLNTFKNWPVAFLKAENLANNGFYYLNRGDEVRCAFCKVEIMRWEPGDDPAADHKKWAPQCPFLRRLAGSSGPAPADGRDECGARAPPSALRLPGPASPEYSTMAARLASYAHWPLSLRQKPKDLADAGFFYTGKGDQTKCFYCDGGLKDWEDDDVPWEQHARWFDRCPYVQLVKGRDYVHKVRADACPSPAAPPDRSRSERPEPASDDESQPNRSETEDEKICKICYEEERNVCFVPCGHVVACARCALATNKCPMCRRTFASAVRLYYA